MDNTSTYILEKIRNIEGIAALLRVFGENGVGGDGLPEAFIYLSERLEDDLVKIRAALKEDDK